MAHTATRLFPKSPEILPGDRGLVTEIWQVAFDGSGAGNVTITVETMRNIVYASCAGSSNNVTATSGRTVIFTFTAGQVPANGQFAQAIIAGKN